MTSVTHGVHGIQCAGILRVKNGSGGDAGDGV